MRLLAAAAVIALGVRIARSRHRRFLHPAGRTFTGSLEIWGAGEPLGAALLDRPGRHDCLVRVSKGAGTKGARADVRGVAIRVGEMDLLLSSTGAGRVIRRLPMPRRSFDTVYGTITPYRTATRKLLIEAVPDKPLGRSLTDVTAGSALLLRAGDREVGRVTIGAALPDETDAGLAFDPVRNTTADLHPTGLIHGTRAFAYRASHRWRGATLAEPNPAAVARTTAHR